MSWDRIIKNMFHAIENIEASAASYSQYLK